VEELKLPEYETPEVTTYSDQEILEELGQARTQSGGPFLPPP
jgi:hypothetical protein